MRRFSKAPPKNPFDVYKKHTIQLENGCILWTGCKKDTGYGQLTFENKHYSAHRFAWFIFKGSLPGKALQIDHICRNKLCVNIEHLRVATVTENHLNSITSDKGGMNRTKCNRGHALTDPNSYYTYKLSNSRTYKYCKICCNSK